ncbi:CDP-glycerol glycerophosphotransferase (TagB/SpsB family) [Scopulibacillus daqui]|uniref:CDP-glycerol glycerophosphotransferase (TagB/SpsB family) n=2 Tax=Scopulibacillus daqui TaxID=1469162 RepID=A0ABS2PZD3_9BACL|nr:CDP-glycerol glycerophosphotransferase family protein [Scopulibacillus daqui]MBM7644925.1 CDP-glycerol glycerophosphotransferase (TagB/SpsB family) [Scopulibacillus daqui]
MVREFIIFIYLFVFKILFNAFNWLPLKRKVTFISTFGQNSLSVYEEIKSQKIDCEIVFLCKPSCIQEFKNINGAKTIAFETYHIIDMIKSAYHIATSQYIFVDNYYGFLSAVKFKEGVECVQLWHAAGALKTFGLKDKNILHRSAAAKKRFSNVYQKFNRVVVGSEAMANIFIEAFDLPPDRILRTGVPRTDLFFDQDYKRRVTSDLYSENQALKSKKVILYAPTFRDHELDRFDLKLDLDKMYRELHDEYVLLLRFHPAVKDRAVNFQEKYPGFVYDYSGYPNVNDLLFVTDILISDYSSIPYEFALLNKPMIFFPYDLKEYRSQRGFWEDYEQSVPGPVVYTTDQLVSQIKDHQFDLNEVALFSKKWNVYSNGHSSKNLVKYLFEKESSMGLQKRERGTL